MIAAPTFYLLRLTWPATTASTTWGQTPSLDQVFWPGLSAAVCVSLECKLYFLQGILSSYLWCITESLLFLFRCIPCALIPFCMRKFKVTEHYCSREDCGILLGKYKGWKGKAAPWSLLFHCFIPSSSSSTDCTKHNKILEVFIIKFEIYLLCMKVLFNIYYI